MTIRSNSFYLEQIIDVTMDVDCQTLDGTLHFGGFGRIPEFRVKNWASPALPAFYVYVRDNKKLTCTSLRNAKTYTLHEIKLMNKLIVSADYITMNNQLPNFDKFELHLTGISVWIEGNRNFILNGDCLERNISTEKISELFSFDSEDYILSTNYHINTHNETSVDSHFSIEHTLVIQKKEKNFSFEECKKVSHELRNLFSLLIGNSLSVSEIWIFNHDDPTRNQWLYFPTVLYEQEPLQYEFEALFPFTYLTNGNKWAGILSQYFSKNTSRDIWQRLLPSYGKMAVWEYGILSRVVILEMYAGVKTTKKKLKMESNLYNDFKQELGKTIDTFKSSKNISGNNLIVFDGMKRSIENIKNTSLPTLKEKYEELMKEFYPALKDAISFTDDDFNKIKKIRDNTVHGLDYKRNGRGSDITYEMQLSDRLLVLLMCFVYLELGFTETEIASFLQHSHCKFIVGANLNKRKLSLLSGNAMLIKLTEQPKNMVLGDYDMVVVNHLIGTNTWYLNEQITQKLRTEYRNIGVSTLLDYVKGIVPNKKGQKIELIQQAYIESERGETEHYSTVVICSCN